MRQRRRHEIPEDWALAGVMVQRVFLRKNGKSGQFVECLGRLEFRDTQVMHSKVPGTESDRFVREVSVASVTSC